jgi:hypothetical protein
LFFRTPGHHGIVKLQELLPGINCIANLVKGIVVSCVIKELGINYSVIITALILATEFDNVEQI